MIVAETRLVVIKTADFATLSFVRYCSVLVKLTITLSTFTTKLIVGHQLPIYASKTLVTCHILGRETE